MAEALITRAQGKSLTRVANDCSIRAVEGKERTIRLSFSSEAPYERWFGPEILDHSEGAVDLSRLNEIGVLLYNHNRDAVIGKIERAWVENGRGEAEATFDTDEDSEKIFRKVQGRTLKGVSVGYLVDSWEEVMPGKQSADGKYTGPCSIARKWAPYEISIVSVPADSGVGVGRSAGDGADAAMMLTYERQLQYNRNRLKFHKEEKTMGREQMIARQNELLALAKSEHRAMNEDERAEFESLQRSINAMDAPAAAVSPGHATRSDNDNEGGEGGSGDGGDTGEEQNAASASEAMARAVEEERDRIRAIEDMCGHFGIDARGYVDSGASVDSVRAAVMERLMQTGAPVRSGVAVAEDENDKFRRAAADGFMLRSGISLEHPADGASEFRAMSLRDLAVECLSREGQGMGGLIRKSTDELFDMVTRQFYNPTAAFPAIMDQTIRKSIVELYNHVPTTFQQITTKGSLPDFKETSDHEYVIGGVGDFLLVPENGEIKPDAPRTEMLPQRKLGTYGKQFSMTRQAFVNDDIGFLTRVPGLYAQAAKKTIDKQVYSILFNNAAIFDGTPLFSTGHKNLIITGSKPTQASIQEIILQMQKQTDQFGEPIYIIPRLIIVPVGYEFDLAVIFHSSQVTGSDHNDINPLYNYPLGVVQTPLLNAMAGTNACPWFMLADQSSARGIQVDYLNGQETPTVRRMETAGTLGFTWDIWLDWGISVRDFRGIAKNPGVPL